MCKAWEQEDIRIICIMTMGGGGEMAMSTVVSKGRTSQPLIIYLGSHRTEGDTTYLPHDSSEDKSQTSGSGPMAYISSLMPKHRR
jgi:hypothetical protein